MAGEKPHGDKTHAQQMDIINRRVDTKNGGKEFDAEADLHRSSQERQTLQESAELTDRADLTDADDRNMIRGTNQESAHNKHRTDR